MGGAVAAGAFDGGAGCRDSEIASHVDCKLRRVITAADERPNRNAIMLTIAFGVARNWRGVRCGLLADWTSVYVRSGGQMRPRGR